MFSRILTEIKKMNYIYKLTCVYKLNGDGWKDRFRFFYFINDDL